MSQNEVKLDSLYAFKMGMGTAYNEKGEAVPVTLLRYEPMMISQIKTNEKEGYSAAQVACMPKKKNNTSSAELARMKKAGFENGAYHIREVRQTLPEGTEVGQKVTITSFAKGDLVTVTSISKGHGFAGAVKRFKLGGGRASHGCAYHRGTGSVGNRTSPGQVMPGKRMPGRHGGDQITKKLVEIIDVDAEENVLMVKGPVAGARNTIIKLDKQMTK